MAASDLEAVREAFELLNSDTYEQVLPLVKDDFEMVTTSAVASEPDTYHGADGVRRWWESFLDAMDYVDLEAHHLEAGDAGRVLVEFTIHARGKTSGIETRQPALALATVVDERLARLEFFTELEQARAAAGLPPR